MRVLLDATAVPADRGGVGRYVDGLLAGLSELAADVAVVGQARDVETLAALAPRLQVLAAPAAVAGRAARLGWEQTGLPALARRVGAEVLHCPHYTMPVAAGRPVVVTVHDLTFVTDPAVHGRLKRHVFPAATRHAARRAAGLVVPSAATAGELLRLTGADPARVTVAHHGVDTAVFHPPTAAEAAAAARAYGPSYVAFLGTLEPRKNLPELVRGFDRAVAGRAEPPVLVLAGGPGWAAGPLEAAIAASSATVLRPGYLPLEQLRGLLGAATVVAYPALAEGFGLPVLEAMACGAPVLTTDRSSLPEVGGEAVAYCGVGAAEIAHALGALLDDPARRAELAAKGVQRAAGFTWAACAETHLSAYERAAR